MNNTRFATLIHILTLLAKFPGKWHSSEWIAGSIGINPAIVRKELQLLHKLGWVQSKKGKEGGTMLAVNSCEISMADIFNAVKNSNVLGRKNTCTGGNCTVGQQINRELEKVFTETDEIVTGALKHRSLKSFAEQFN
ncbi:Rrf2 family transcriptional regulator [Chryseobacterium sp. MFBS3-17]|uniref:Rrf2 family transcriptional regulator n=1 Tax=Chryseobacterium sp. MFBS3-17 TaxID=2886689 RepID=UPI001D0E8661|nr:Rrf2 family transcriptional regulator [Chryseobacterium sp. MFBS3-17]MCC2590845.1 Rrf2 family transcriptional regulator [Chryseobacterium sp. MFBS3-17]